MPTEQILSADAVREIAARPSVSTSPLDQRVLLTSDERDALCQTVRALREELKHRVEALEELRRARDGWLALLNPANPEETVEGAIRNLQQAYITERDNAETADQQLSEVTKERDDLRDELEKIKGAGVP